MSILSSINRLQRHWTSHVLLYHSTFSTVPADLQLGLHNVTPDTLRRQILWLKNYFDIVTIDAVCAEPRAGKMAITFDDGYLSVFEEALPVLMDLQVPCTVFLNGCSLEGRPFWRDKVRYILNAKLTRPFLETYKDLHGTTDGMTEEHFYRTSKLAVVNSKKIDDALDHFLQKQSVSLSDFMYCIRNPAQLVRHPLVTYGNHTMHHYLLSSLTDDEQRREIMDNHTLLESLNVPLSRIFSIPFGDTTDFTPSTLDIAREAGYTGFLYSRNRINLPRRKNTTDGGLRGVERYMVPASFDAFQKQLLGMWAKGTIR